MVRVVARNNPEYWSVGANSFAQKGFVWPRCPNEFGPTIS